MSGIYDREQESASPLAEFRRVRERERYLERERRARRARLVGLVADLVVLAALAAVVAVALVVILPQ